MPANQERKIPFKLMLAAAQKLSPEEKQLLWRKLFAAKAIREMKELEAEWSKKYPIPKKTDEEIVSVVKKIRKTRNASPHKMLH
jgi:hypothetical protein